MLVAVDLKKWAVIYVEKNGDVAKSFLNLMTKVNHIRLETSRTKHSLLVGS